MDIITKSTETKSLKITNTSNVETFTVLENGNIGIRDAAPLVPVHFKLNNTPSVSAVSVGGQNYDVTGTVFDQTLQSASTNPNNSQNLFQGVYSYTGTSKNNNVITVNAISQSPSAGSYSNTNALNAVAENKNSNSGVITAVNMLSKSSANIGTLLGSAAGFSNDSGTANLASGLQIKNSNAGIISNYRGINISNLVNSGSIESTTGIYIGFLTAGTQLSKYSLQSLDLSAGMWHKGKVSLSAIVDPNTTSTQLTTTSLAVAVDSDSTLPTSGLGASQNTVIMGDGFVSTNPNYVLPNPSTAKGRLYTLVVVSDLSPVSLSVTGGSSIYHISDAGKYVADNSYNLQKGSRTYISDGYNWFVVSSSTEQNSNGFYPN